MDYSYSTRRDHKSRLQSVLRRQGSALKTTGEQTAKNMESSARALLNPAAASPQDILHLQKIAGNQAVSGLIQAKLRVGPAGDEYEQQADRIAEQVVQSLPAKQTGAFQGDAAASDGLQSARADSQTAQKNGFLAGAKTEQRLQSLRGSGKPLPVGLRREMETYMGADFSEVRLHTNSEASQLNRRLAARAFTQGQDIFLDSGEYNPGGREGKRLLAHELTHVLQQTGKRPLVAQQAPGRALGRQADPVTGSISAAGETAHAGGIVQRYNNGYDDDLDLEGLEEDQEEPQGERKLPHSRLAIDLANAGDSTPAPLKLPEKYRDEEKKVGWRAFQGAKDDEDEQKKQRRAAHSEKTSIVTKHFDDAERARNELDESTPDFDRKIYAMNPAGRVVTGTGVDRDIRSSGQEVREHHSSMFAGGDVAHAGHIGLQQGKVNYLDDDSGHYRPTAAHTWDAYNRFKKSGKLADTGAVKNKVSMVDKSLQKGVDFNYDASKLELPFFAYEQTHGNEEQARNKQAMLNELKGNRPKTKSASDAPLHYVNDEQRQTIPAVPNMGYKKLSLDDDSEKGRDNEEAPSPGEGSQQPNDSSLLYSRKYANSDLLYSSEQKYNPYAKQQVGSPYLMPLDELKYKNVSEDDKSKEDEE